MINKSLTMSGVHSCSGGCTYCSGASSMCYSLMGEAFKNYSEDLFKKLDGKTLSEFQANWEKLKLLIANDRQVRQELENAKKMNRQPEIHFDIWGANPVSCFSAFKLTIENIKKLLPGWIINLSTSDNGTTFGNKEYCDFLLENKIQLQLSHDGIGEWMRLPFDPLFDDNFRPNADYLLKNNIWTSTNATLSFYNSQFFENLKYFNPILDQVPRTHYLKLNHAYDSDYDLKAINKEGRWQNGFVEELKGKPIGDWSIHNGTNPWDKHTLDNYMQDLFHLGLLCLDPIEGNKPLVRHVKSYINEQCSRVNYIKTHDQKTGACRAFQRYKHNIGEKEGWEDQTFVWTTNGEYSECNLIDEQWPVENPGGVQPDYCKGCKFEFWTECNGCGSKHYRSECQYNYALGLTIEKISYVKGLLNNETQAIKNRIVNNLFGESCNGRCR